MKIKNNVNINIDTNIIAKQLSYIFARVLGKTVEKNNELVLGYDVYGFLLLHINDIVIGKLRMDIKYLRLIKEHNKYNVFKTLIHDDYKVMCKNMIDS